MNDWIEASLFAETGTTRIAPAATVDNMRWCANGWAVYESNPSYFSGPKVGDSPYPYRDFLYISESEVAEHIRQWIASLDHEPSCRDLINEQTRWREKNVEKLFAEFVAKSDSARIVERFFDGQLKENARDEWLAHDYRGGESPATDPLYDLLKAWLVEAVTAKKATSL